MRWRSLDWRFVMPFPSSGGFPNLLLLGGCDVESRLIAESGWAQRIARDISESGAADAIVVRSAATISIAAAARCLTPGGVLYLEVDRRVRGRGWSPARVLRQIRRAGLRATGTYWVAPDFDRTAMYVPLDVDGALRWYAANLSTASTFAQRARHATLRLVSLAGVRRVASVVRCYAVTATRGTSDDGYAPLCAHQGLPDSVRDADVRPLVLLGGDSDFNRVALLPFSPRSERPLAVLKVGRFPEPLNARIEWEQYVLAELSKARTAKGSVPAPLGIVRSGALEIGVESCAPGRLLSSSLARWGASRTSKIADLRRVVSWMCEFHTKAQIDSPAWNADAAGRWIAAPLADYVKVLGPATAEEPLFDAARRGAAALAGVRLPIVWLHWGFTARNIYRDGEHITVVDWEGAGPGPSLLDVVHFVTTWYEGVEQGRVRNAQPGTLRRLYVDDDAHGDRCVAAARSALRDYMASLGIDQRFLPPMLVTMLVKRALGHVRLVRAGTGTDAGPATQNRYARYLGSLAGHVDDLFARWRG